MENETGNFQGIVLLHGIVLVGSRESERKRSTRPQRQDLSGPASTGLPDTVLQLHSLCTAGEPVASGKQTTLG